MARQIRNAEVVGMSLRIRLAGMVVSTWLFALSCSLPHPGVFQTLTAGSEQPVQFIQVGVPDRANLKPGHVVFAAIVTSHPAGELGVIEAEPIWTPIRSITTQTSQGMIRIDTFYRTVSAGEPLHSTWKLVSAPGATQREPRAVLSATVVSVKQSGVFDSSGGSQHGTTPAFSPGGESGVVALVVAHANNSDFRPPVGWTLVSQVKGGAEPNAHRHVVAARFYRRGETIPQTTVPTDTGTSATAVQILAFRKP